MIPKATASERLGRTKQAAVARATGQGWPVLAHGTNAGSITPSIDMPRADTELTSLLAGDAAVCVRRKALPAQGATAALKTASAGAFSRQPISGRQAFSGTQAESLAAMSRQFEESSKDEWKPSDLTPKSESGSREVAATEGEPDLNLRRVQAAWPMLPRAVQAAILTLIDATLE